MNNENPSSTYLSFIVSGRNDDYGKHYIYRLQNFVNSIQIMSDEFKLKTQTIIIEWNPPNNENLLSKVINKTKSEYNTITFIVIPFDFHETFINPMNLPVHDYVAKNIGICRARGEYILVCSGDLIFTKELFSLFNSKVLTYGKIYRNTRIDFKKFNNRVLSENNYTEFLEDIKNNTFSSTFKNENDGSMQYANTNIDIIDGYFCQKKNIYFDGCGDFLLMSKKDWIEVEGCISDTKYFTHIDSATLLKIINLYKKDQMVLHPMYSVYHMDHSRPHLAPNVKYDMPNINEGGKLNWGFDDKEFQAIEM